jgi:hypothetical protein
MDEFLKQLLEMAKDKHKAHKYFFKRLKKKPPKHLNQIMQQLHEETFEEVDCLTCANCCKTTGPLFLNKDIERIFKHFRMKPSVFIDTYLRVEEENDYVLPKVPCSFLSEDNQCSIYDVRLKAC